MDLPTLNLPQTPAAPADDAGAATELRLLLERYGIVSIPDTVYEWGGYRYTNSTDAIAAAKRATR